VDGSTRDVRRVDGDRDTGTGDKVTHYFAWKNNVKRLTLYGRNCRIVAAGKMNSICIEFDNGQREIVSRRSVRKIK
jgi:hypothetical protein